MRLVALNQLLLVVSSGFAVCSGAEPEGQAQLEGLSSPFGQQTAQFVQQRGKLELERSGKTLVNTFPFNARNDDGHDHHHAHDHDHDHHQAARNLNPLTAFDVPPPLSAVDNRFSRQGSGSDDVALDIGSIAAAGERCIDKVITVEETEYDEEIECHHSYTERCHVTYKTDYTPQQEEECDETFKKNCFIEYKKKAFKEKVKFCYQPLVKNCNLPSPVECITDYQTQCTTRYHEHEVEDDVTDCQTVEELKCEQITQGYTTDERCTKWPKTQCAVSRETVKKYSPETDCQKVPYEVCGPAACPTEPGPEQCQDKEETIVQEVPEEICNLEPRRECKHVTKLVPLLKEHENCLDIPKEVCSRSRKNPRKIAKPIVKKWCYTPREPGLTPGSGGSSGGSSGGATEPPTRQGCIPNEPKTYCEGFGSNKRCGCESCIPRKPIYECEGRGSNKICGCDFPRCIPGKYEDECDSYEGRRICGCERRTTTQPPLPGCIPNEPKNYCEGSGRNKRCGCESCIPRKPIYECEGRGRNKICGCDIPRCLPDRFTDDCESFDGRRICGCDRKPTTTPPPPTCIQGRTEDYCEGFGRSRRCGCSPRTTPPPPTCIEGRTNDYCEGFGRNRRCGCDLPCIPGQPRTKCNSNLTQCGCEDCIKNKPNTYCEGTGRNKICGCRRDYLPPVPNAGYPDY